MRNAENPKDTLKVPGLEELVEAETETTNGGCRPVIPIRPIFPIKPIRPWPIHHWPLLASGGRPR